MIIHKYEIYTSNLLRFSPCLVIIQHRANLRCRIHLEGVGSILALIALHPCTALLTRIRAIAPLPGIVCISCGISDSRASNTYTPYYHLVPEATATAITLLLSLS